MNCTDHQVPPQSTTNLFEKLTDSSIDRVIAIDTGWKIIAWNLASEQFSGLAKTEVMGKHLLEIFPQLSSDNEMIQAVDNAFNGFKSFLPVKPGLYSRQYVENHFIPLREDNRKITGVLNIVHDVSHRIKAEKKLAHLNLELEKKYSQLAKANKDLANFIYITGRDVKDPIRHIYSTIEILVRKEGYLLSNTNRGNLRKAQASLNKMSLLLDDMMAISAININKPAFQHVHLNNIAENAISKIRQKLSEKEAVINIDPLPVINGCEEMLMYLFQQLLDNALKFQYQNQKPIININCSTAPGNDFLEIIFQNNGIGFDESESDKIFDMFVKLNGAEFRGSGIGLSICKKIMDMHEGMITAENVEGSGSIFKCYFPANF